MEKKLFGYNIRIDVKNRIDEIAKEKRMSSSALVDSILLEYADNYVGKVKVEEAPFIKMTEEERLADWEFRKRMVAEGKFPPEFAMEYPSGYDKPTDTNDFVLQ